MEKKQTAVQWLIENAKGFHNAESSKAMQEQALQMEKERMIGFAHYLRNGLTNKEYCQKKHEEHLEYWCQNYR
jgi:hypothetical protein